ncbi:GNAT family N-acetyltransferase [Nocardioides pakistanensis]
MSAAVRVPRGTPAGGQFAATARAEAPLGLPGWQPVVRPGEPQYGHRVVEGLINGQLAGCVTYDVDVDDPDGPTIRVDYISTRPSFRGRGVAASMLRSLAEEHPGACFETAYFETPVARRVWDRALGDRSLMGAEYRCVQCGLDIDGAAERCRACVGYLSAHDLGEHAAEPVRRCWRCNTP